MTVDESVVDGLLDSAVDEPVAFDGLRLHREEDGWTLAIEGEERRGLAEDALREMLVAEAPAHVTNWWFWQTVVAGERSPRRAFLRWCEGARIDAEADGGSTSDGGSMPGGGSTTDSADDGSSVGAGSPVEERYGALRTGIVREWGQLRITVRLPSRSTDGERQYEVRHVADADADPVALDDQSGPGDVRAIVTEDADGRYRPLKTAPTLVSGWRFAGLAGDELVAVVEGVYPATIANWHRERRGELDVDHWLETAERQTGIYDVVDELPRQAVDWLAEACCVDSQCLRRREWGYTGDDSIDVDGGGGEFPCREPCSLVIAAARRFAIAESESDRTVELELTTTELNQLSALIDAVAEGRIEAIREADLGDGANRFRARYLRAKRFDEDGSLAATVDDGVGDCE